MTSASAPTSLIVSISGRKILLHAYGTAKMAEYVGRLAKVGSLGVSPAS